MKNLIVTALCVLLASCSSEVEFSMENLAGEWKGKVSGEITNFDHLPEKMQEKVREVNKNREKISGRLDLRNGGCTTVFNNAGSTELSVGENNCKVDLGKRAIIPADKIIEVYGHDIYRITSLTKTNMVLKGSFKKSRGKGKGTIINYTIELEKKYD